MAGNVVYTVINTAGNNWVPVICDLPPVRTAIDRFGPPYRDLSAQGVSGIVNITTAPILVETIVSPPSIVTVSNADALQSMADDISHTAFRQDSPFKQDWLVFTNTLGALCGEFNLTLWPSWTNGGPPGSTPTLPSP